eukprot:Colp12_sorted_trinity150504_noHs@15734
MSKEQIANEVKVHEIALSHSVNGQNAPGWFTTAMRELMGQLSDLQAQVTGVQTSLDLYRCREVNRRALKYPTKDAKPLLELPKPVREGLAHPENVGKLPSRCGVVGFPATTKELQALDEETLQRLEVFYEVKFEGENESVRTSSFSWFISIGE